MAKDDPYYDKRTYHKGALMNAAGDVSPLCAKKPRRLDLKKHQLWTNRWEAVNCKKCLALK